MENSIVRFGSWMLVTEQISELAHAQTGCRIVGVEEIGYWHTFNKESPENRS